MAAGDRAVFSRWSHAPRVATDEAGGRRGREPEPREREAVLDDHSVRGPRRRRAVAAPGRSQSQPADRPPPAPPRRGPRTSRARAAPRRRRRGGRPARRPAHARGSAPASVRAAAAGVNAGAGTAVAAPRLHARELEQQVPHVGRRDPVARERGIGAQQHRRVVGTVRQPAVRAAHARRVERDDLHGVAEPSFLRSSVAPAFGLAQLVRRVEEELGGVVAGLAVDLHVAREVGRPLVVEPVVVGEPGVGLGDEHDLARALVAEAGVAPRVALARR